jgi:TPR repeat protein
MVAICYQIGMGGYPRDRVQAAAWFRKAAEQGDRSAEVNLGRAYRHGYGVTTDHAQSMAWFQKAADHGSGAAENELGEMYEGGEGVPKDVAVALQHYRIAADRIQPSAWLKLATFYEEGTGVTRDLVEADKWWTLYIPFSVDRLAADRAHLDALEAKMTAAELAEAQRRADAWAQAHKPRR